ncbi:hypothetical protein JW835_15820 [bacterium]|nr:hypothetical protein [bacterium]
MIYIRQIFESDKYKKIRNRIIIFWILLYLLFIIRLILYRDIGSSWDESSLIFPAIYLIINWVISVSLIWFGYVSCIDYFKYIQNKLKKFIYIISILLLLYGMLISIWVDLLNRSFYDKSAYLAWIALDPFFNRLWPDNAGFYYIIIGSFLTIYSLTGINTEIKNKDVEMNKFRDYYCAACGYKIKFKTKTDVELEKIDYNNVDFYNINEVFCPRCGSNRIVEKDPGPIY